MRKRLVLLLIISVMVFSLWGCKKKESDVLVLRIANCEEYIDEGDWDEEELIELEDGTEIIGENSLIDDFEAWYEETYGIEVRVEYSTYGTNEDLYNQLTVGSQFDLVCPSEYMIMKMMDEGMLQPFSEEFYDESSEHNYYIKGVSPYIKNVFSSLEMNGETLDKYGAGYMWGTMGIVYNPEMVSQKEVENWAMLLNNKYFKQITMKDGVRDSYFVALCILNQDLLMDKSFRSRSDYAKALAEVLNDTSQETVDKIEVILTEMKDNSYSIETDSGKSDMVTGKVVANMQWSGDAVYSLDQAEEDGVELAFSVPEEGSNIWFDGWCMLKAGIAEDQRKQHAAEAFINYVSRPDNVIRNMYYIGYTSCISGGDSDLIYLFAKYYYEAEDDVEEEVVEYPLDYFFLGRDQADAGKYVIEAPVSQTRRQLFSQYPTVEVIDRCAVMGYFDKETNQRISRMWTNIRCFHF